MSQHSHDGDEILRRMAEIRGNLHHEAEGIAENARVMTDWRFYLRSYPWACVGAAAAVGYLMVPNRLQIISPDVNTLLKLAKKNRLSVTPEPEPQKRGGLVGTLFTFAANTAVRGLISYAGQQAGKYAGHFAHESTEQPLHAEPRRPR